MSQSPFSTSIYREAAQGVVGGSLAWFATCAVASIIAEAATCNGVEDIMGNISWEWIFAWLGHLVLAAMGLWGLIIICIHVGCLAALIQGAERVMTVLAIAFVSQLTASALVLAAFDNGGDGADIKRRITIVWLACAVPVIVFLGGTFVRQARD